MRVRTHAHTQAHTHMNTGAHTEATQGCLPWEASLSLPPADFSGPAGPCAFLPPAKVTLGCFVNPSGQSSRCQDTHFSWDVGVRTFPRASRGPGVSSNEHTAGKVGLAGPGGSERLKGHGLHGTSIFTSLDLQSTWGSKRGSGDEAGGHQTPGVETLGSAPPPGSDDAPRADGVRGATSLETEHPR